MDTRERSRQGSRSRPSTAQQKARQASGPSTGQKIKQTPSRQDRQSAGQPEQGKRKASTRQQPSSAARRGKRGKPTSQRASSQRKPSRPRPTPEVVYTPPKPFSRNRLLLHLATIVAVVIAVIFGMSIFFKVENVVVSGTRTYSAWAVREASGIQQGDNLLTFSKPKASGLIRAALPYVKSVRIGIKLPDTVNIEIVETDVVYSVRDGGGYWWLMTSEGRVVEQVDSAKAGEYTTALGVQLANPAVNQDAVAVEQAPAETDPSTGETVPVTVRGSQRLEAVLSILQYLEQNGIIGQAASVDVSDLGRIKLWYGQQYEVILGDNTQLSYKISCLKSAVDQMDEYQNGVLDISFTTWPDQVGYTPFS